MITKNELLDLLIESSTQFKEISVKELDDNDTLWKDEDGNILYHSVLAAYAGHIVTLYKHQIVGKFDKIFELIEMLHLNGDSYIKEAATIGILEGIQNISGNSNLDPRVFEQYLHPESMRWWNSLKRFWDKEIPYVGADIIEPIKP